MNKKEMISTSFIIFGAVLMFGSIMFAVGGSLYDSLAMETECRGLGYSQGTFDNVEIGCAKCYSYVYENHERKEVSQIVEYNSWFRGS